MKLRTLPKTKKLKGQRVLVRVDWNIPLEGEMESEVLLKIERSLVTVHDLVKRGAIVILLTHLGRPKKRELSLSTKQLVPIVKRLYGLELTYHGEVVSDKGEGGRLAMKLSEAEEGSVHLLENVRFEEGEEKNSVALSKAYARLADLFINDAFASCHRSHVSVAGIAKQLPSFAGVALQEEVRMLSVFLKKPQRPFVAVIGGKKLTTKLPVVKALLKMCDAVMVGGAMSHACFAAQGISIGGSYVEKEALSEAKKLLQSPNLFLPIDVMLADGLSNGAKLVRSSISSVGKGKKWLVVDAGPVTLKTWAEKLQSAKTILWNGPIGVTEIKHMGAGSRFLARVIGGRSRGAAFGVAGGGDTIPVIVQAKVHTWFDFVSTGGGAMLEFIALKGSLPGLAPLLK